MLSDRAWWLKYMVLYTLWCSAADWQQRGMMFRMAIRKELDGFRSDIPSRR